MKILILSCVLSVCFIAVGVYATPAMLIPAGVFAAVALGASYNLGARQGFVVGEDMLPPEIYQVIAITMAGSFPIAILRNSKKKRIACRSLALAGFAYFSIVGEGNEKFLVPDSLKQATTTGFPVAGSDPANSHGG